MRKLALLLMVFWLITACTVHPVSSHPVMRVTFERSGGFAGLMITSTADTATMSDAEVEQLEHMVAEAEFFKLPSHIPSGSPQPDRFQYNITIEQEQKRHSVEVGETSVPEKLRPLIDWMDQRSRQR